MFHFLRKLLLISLGLLWLTPQLYSEVTVGQPAPNFTLSDTLGKIYSLADFKGKNVVLEWFNYDCPFVAKQYDSGSMQKLQETYTGKGIVWLAINSSAPGKEGNYSPDQLNKMAKSKKANPTAILLDSDGTVGRLYAAQTTPHMFIIDAAGNLVYQGAIDDIPSTDVTDIEKSHNYVRMALDEILAGKPVTTSATKSYGCSVKY